MDSTGSKYVNKIIKISIDDSKLPEILHMIRGALINEKKAFLQVGALLTILVENKRYKKLGYKNKSELFKDLNICYSHAYNYLNVWAVFGEYLLNNRIYPPFKRLIRLLPIVKHRKDELPDWVHKANVLMPQDFDVEIRAIHMTDDILKCIHKDFDLWLRCKTCQRWLKKVAVRNTDSKLIGQESSTNNGETKYHNVYSVNYVDDQGVKHTILCQEDTKQQDG